MKTTMKWLGIGATIALTAGCSASDSGEGPGTGATDAQVQVELFSWWISPGEAEALQALVDLNKSRFPHARIYNAAAESGADARQILSDRLEADEPPDLFQENSHALSSFLAENPGKLAPLDQLFDDLSLWDAVVPEVLDDVSFDGSVFAMPVNIHRENSLFYNKEIFQRYDLDPPTTIEEFFSACQALEAEGVTPVATAYQGWILRIMFNSLTMGLLGAAEFERQWTGEAPMSEADLSEAIDNLERVLSEYSNDDAGDEGFGWTEAARAVFEGEAAMFLHGDWAKGYFVQLGWTPDVDFGVVGAPGAANMFWYGVDVFALPAGAPEPDAAADFLSTVASIDGQVGFNGIKGSTPMRLDVPSSRLDAMGREVLADLQAAEVRAAVVNLDAWDAALVEFAQSRDKAALVDAYLSNPPE